MDVSKEDLAYLMSLSTEDQELLSFFMILWKTKTRYGEINEENFKKVLDEMVEEYVDTACKAIADINRIGYEMMYGKTSHI